MIFQWLILACIGGRRASPGCLVFTSGWVQQGLMMVALLLTQGHQFSTCQAKLRGTAPPVDSFRPLAHGRAAHSVGQRALSHGLSIDL